MYMCVVYVCVCVVHICLCAYVMFMCACVWKSEEDIRWSHVSLWVFDYAGEQRALKIPLLPPYSSEVIDQSLYIAWQFPVFHMETDTELGFPFLHGKPSCPLSPQLAPSSKIVSILGVVKHARNPSTWEASLHSELQSGPSYLGRPCLKSKQNNSTKRPALQVFSVTMLLFSHNVCANQEIEEICLPSCLPVYLPTYLSTIMYFLKSMSLFFGLLAISTLDV